MYTSYSLHSVTLAQMHVIAQDAGMSFALGRAAHLKSRMQNQGHSVLAMHGLSRVTFTLACISYMRKIRATTAKRWQAHILQGGSLKGLCHKSHANFLAKRRKLHAKEMAWFLYAKRPSCRPTHNLAVVCNAVLTEL